jgi:hypothetical protein
MSSVALMSLETARFGALVMVTGEPQLCTVTGYAALPGEAVVDGCAAAAVPALLPHPATAVAPARSTAKNATDG